MPAKICIATGFSRWWRLITGDREPASAIAPSARLLDDGLQPALAEVCVNALVEKPAEAGSGKKQHPS